jgi:hypothetical protein
MTLSRKRVFNPAGQLGGLLVAFGLLSGCANQNSALEVTRMLFGYIEPPKAESVMETLRREYDRCMAIDSQRDCVQLAYDKVRVTQGLDPKPIPKGYVVIIKEEIEKKPAKPADEQPQQP